MNRAGAEWAEEQGKEGKEEEKLSQGFDSLFYTFSLRRWFNPSKNPTRVGTIIIFFKQNKEVK